MTGHLETMIFEDGVYEGYMLDGKRSGAGRFAFSTGDFFAGQWEDDLMHGNLCESCLKK